MCPRLLSPRELAEPRALSEINVNCRADQSDHEPTIAPSSSYALIRATPLNITVLSRDVNNMKALSIRQPWANKIVDGEKTVENRTWRTKYRGPLLIHAAGQKEIIGQVSLLDCKPLVEVKTIAYAEGPWCWILSMPQRFDSPIPYRGRLGLFEVPEVAFQRTENSVAPSGSRPDNRS